MKKKAKKTKEVKIEYECYFEDPKCNFESEFAILVKTEKEARIVDAKINKALEVCIATIKLIGKAHPGAGIGDTATDECIAEKFYDTLHWQV